MVGAALCVAAAIAERGRVKLEQHDPGVDFATSDAVRRCAVWPDRGDARRGRVNDPRSRPAPATPSQPYLGLRDLVPATRSSTAAGMAVAATSRPASFRATSARPCGNDCRCARRPGARRGVPALTLRFGAPPGFEMSFALSVRFPSRPFLVCAGRRSLGIRVPEYFAPNAAALLCPGTRGPTAVCALSGRAPRPLWSWSTLMTCLKGQIYRFATALVATLDARDQYTAGHSAAVAIYARDIAVRLGSLEEIQKMAHVAGLVHDVGKIGLAPGLLEKARSAYFRGTAPNGATSSHRRTNPTDVRVRGISDAVRHHHERLDGRGYPDGLSGTPSQSLRELYQSLTPITR